jgi:prepilin-type processing-associated H-X9-DG protein
MTKTATWSAATIHTGYNMNIFPFAPADLDGTGNYAVNQRKIAQQNSDGHDSLANASPPSPAALLGRFWQSSAWKKPSERALMFDAVHPLVVLSHSTAKDYVTKWPYKPENPGGDTFPTEPDGSNFSLDYNRHGKNNVASPPDAMSMNMLFCDGHAEFVSAREAYRAIRFK